MGAVYKAWQVASSGSWPSRSFAPMLTPIRAAAARFQAEAEAAARLQHPNIVQVFEVGEHDGMGYLVLEYEAGWRTRPQARGHAPGPDMTRPA